MIYILHTKNVKLPRNFIIHTTLYKKLYYFNPYAKRLGKIPENEREREEKEEEKKLFFFQDYNTYRILLDKRFYYLFYTIHYIVKYSVIWYCKDTVFLFLIINKVIFSQVDLKILVSRLLLIISFN